MDPREEEELRRLVRRELENRERLRGSGAADSLRRPGELSAERRRIIEEEIEAFYRAKGNYVRYENEDGEVEWLTPEEIAERERQLPVDMEELETGQRRVRIRLVLLVLLAFLAVVLLFVLLKDRTGSIQVICNVPNAVIYLNGAPTEFVTDATLENIPVGPHVISVSKYGYVPDGPASRRVTLRAGETEAVVLKLKPMLRDTLGRPK